MIKCLQFQTKGVGPYKYLLLPTPVRTCKSTRKNACETICFSFLMYCLSVHLFLFYSLYFHIFKTFLKKHFFLNKSDLNLTQILLHYINLIIIVAITIITSLDFIFPTAASLIAVSNYFSKVALCKYTRYYPEYKRLKSSCAAVSSGHLIAQLAVTPGALLHYTRSLSDSSSHESERNASTARHSVVMSVLSQSVTSVCSAEPVAFTWKTSSGKIQQGEQQDVFQLCLKERAIWKKLRW